MAITLLVMPSFWLKVSSEQSISQKIKVLMPKASLRKINSSSQNSLIWIKKINKKKNDFIKKYKFQNKLKRNEYELVWQYTF